MNYKAHNMIIKWHLMRYGSSSASIKRRFLATFSFISFSFLLSLPLVKKVFFVSSRFLCCGHISFSMDRGGWQQSWERGGRKIIERTNCLIPPSNEEERGRRKEEAVIRKICIALLTRNDKRGGGICPRANSVSTAISDMIELSTTRRRKLKECPKF